MYACLIGVALDYSSLTNRQRCRNFFGSQSGSFHECAIFEHGALRKVRVNFICSVSLHHCIPPQKAVIQNCVDCPLRQFSWLRLVTYLSILQLAANILLPPTTILFAPVSTVGNVF